MVDWSALPIELWELVAKRLHLADCHRFAAVCSTWRSIIQERRHCKFPWIVLSDFDDNRPDTNTHPFWKLVDNKVCRLQSPEIRGKRCCGSSHRWLITASENSDSFHLLNPFSRVEIFLPPPSAFPHTQCSNPPDFPRNRYSIHKAIVSSDPATYSEYTMMAIYSERARLAFFKSGTERWIHVKSMYPFQDLVYNNGQFYTNCEDGTMVVYRLGDRPKTIIIALPLPHFIAGPEPEWYKPCHHPKPYLVESSGELLQVWRLIKFIGYDVEDDTDDDDDDDDDFPYETFAVKVFRIDKKVQGGRVEATSLSNGVVPRFQQLHLTFC